MARKKVVKEQEWRITRIRGSAAAYVGTVAAPNAESAIKKAIEEFRITAPHQQQRLVARGVA
jgi:hypothetical protein